MHVTSGLALAAAACGGNDDEGSTALSIRDSDQYAIVSSVFGPDTSTSFLVTVPGLESDVEPDYGRALEVPGLANVIGRPEERKFFVGNGETRSLTEYLVEGNRVVTGRTLSFANLGVTDIISPGRYVFVSPTKAYYFNDQTRGAIIWDPEAMSVVGEIPLPDADVQGFSNFQVADNVIVRGSSVLVPVFWHDGDYVRFNTYGRIYEIDSATDEVIATRDFSECVGLVTASIADDGIIFVSTDGYMAFTRYVLGGSNGSQSCAIEIPPGQTVAEATVTDLSLPTGGKPGGSVLASGEATYIRVRENADAYNADSYDEGIDAGEMRWYTWDQESGTALPAESALSAAGGSFYFQPDRRLFSPSSSDDFSSAVLVELRPSGTPSPGVEIRGFPFGVVKFRD